MRLSRRKRFSGAELNVPEPRRKSGIGKVIIAKAYVINNWAFAKYCPSNQIAAVRPGYSKAEASET